MGQPRGVHGAQLGAQECPVRDHLVPLIDTGRVAHSQTREPKVIGDAGDDTISTQRRAILETYAGDRTFSPTDRIRDMAFRLLRTLALADDSW